MSLPVTITKAPFPAGYCWPGPDQYGTDLVALLTAVVAGNISAFVIGTTTPAPSDQNKPWFRFNPDGTPDKWYIYVGAWISLHPVPPSSASRIIWTGSEASLWAYDGGDGTNPTISAPTDTTGAMWQRDLAFGKDDGTASFRVPVGIGKNPTAYDGNPATVITPGATGGEERHVIVVGELATHTHIVGSDTVNQSGAANPVHQVHDYSTAPEQTSASGPAGSSLSHQNMPPYLGVIFAQRTVRRFYVAT